MAKIRTFAEHRSEMLIADFKAGRLSRRDFLFAASILGIAPSVATSRLAHGQALELVLAGNWGGDQLKSVNETWVKTYQQKTGNKMSVDGSNPSNPKIRAMVESRTCDLGHHRRRHGGDEPAWTAGQLEEVDYNIVDRDQLLPGFDFKHGIANYLFGVVLVWNNKLVSSKPTNSKDYYDTKKFPGKRTMRKSAIPQIELALLGDGVPRDKVYPLDRQRALNKLASVKSEVIFWETGSESEVHARWRMRYGAALVRSCGRAQTPDEGQIDFTFENGILQQGAWVVPVGNKAGKEGLDDRDGGFPGPAMPGGLLQAAEQRPPTRAPMRSCRPSCDRLNRSLLENLNVMVKIGTNWYLQGKFQDFSSRASLISSRRSRARARQPITIVLASARFLANWTIIAPRSAAWRARFMLYGLVVPGVVVTLLVFYLLPLVQVLWISVTEPEPGLGNYGLLFTSPSIAWGSRRRGSAPK